MTELERHKTVAVFLHLFLGEFPVADVALGQDVIHLRYFGMEFHPFLRVILHELAVNHFLRNYQVGAYLRKLTSFKIVEVATGQELRIFRHLMVVGLLAEDVLLLQGIALAKGLHHIGKHILKEKVLSGIGTQLLDRVGHFEDDGRLAFG